MVDDDDYEKIKHVAWHAHFNRSGNAYAIHTTSRKNIGGQTAMRMHRIIMGLSQDDPRYVDHVDNNGLNNQKSNLRICTPSQNSANRVSRGKGSKYLGVSFWKRNNKWGVTTAKDGKQYFHGLYVDEKQAAKVYNEKATELHGVFAKLNTIE